jgi:hypothetical protein
MYYNIIHGGGMVGDMVVCSPATLPPYYGGVVPRLLHVHFMVVLFPGYFTSISWWCCSPATSPHGGLGGDQDVLQHYPWRWHGW